MFQELVPPDIVGGIKLCPQYNSMQMCFKFIYKYLYQSRNSDIEV